MKRSLSSLITDTNVREFKAIEIDISLINRSCLLYTSDAADE